MLALPATEVNCVNQDNSTALHAACDSGNHEIVSLLLYYGAKPHVEDNIGCTPLIYACIKGHTQVAEILVKNLPKKNLEHKNRQGLTALACAMSAGHFEVAKVLIRQGANIKVNLLGDKSLLVTALEAEKKDSELIDLLLKQGAKLPKDYEDPVRLAAEDGDAMTIKVLHNHGFQIDKPDAYGRTPLMHASLHGEFEAVIILISCGAVIHRRDRFDKSALDMAVTAALPDPSHVDVIEQLVAHSRPTIVIHPETVEPLWSLAISRLKTPIPGMTDISQKNPGHGALAGEILNKGLYDSKGNLFFVDTTKII